MKNIPAYATMTAKDHLLRTGWQDPDLRRLLDQNYGQ